MKTKVLLITAYCIPFAFLGIFFDSTFNTIVFYVIMIAGYTLLCCLALKTGNTAIIFIGNILSFLSSYVFAKLTLNPMGHYFKPFTAHSLIIVISVIAIILQAFVILIYVRKKLHKSRGGIHDESNWQSTTKGYFKKRL